MKPMLDDDEKIKSVSRVGMGWIEFKGDDGTIVRMYGEFSVEHVVNRSTRLFYDYYREKERTVTTFMFAPTPGKLDDRGSLYTVQVPKKKTATVVVAKNQLINLDAVAEAVGMKKSKYTFMVHDEGEDRLRIELEEV